MQVKHLGITLRCTKGVAVPDLVNYLVANSGLVASGEHDPERRLYAVRNGEWLIGLIVTFKDHRKFCEAEENNGVVSFTVREVQLGRSLVEFNHFLVHAETGRGIYQHYHQSCSVAGAAKLVRTAHDAVREMARAALAATLQDSSEATRNRSVAQAIPARGTQFDIALIVTAKSLEALLKNMLYVNSLAFELVSYELPDNALSPLKARVKAYTHRLSFMPKVSPDDTLVKSIARLFGKARTAKGHVVCTNVEGLRQTIRLGENAEAFGDAIHFDDIASDIEVNTSTFASSKIVRRLLEKANERIGFWRTTDTSG